MAYLYPSPESYEMYTHTAAKMIFLKHKYDYVTFPLKIFQRQFYHGLLIKLKPFHLLRKSFYVLSPLHLSSLVSLCPTHYQVLSF